jgi:hypothetical protein
MPGMAHWTYDDWSAHVVDAWVLRLQAPVQRPSGYAGGYRAVAKQELQPGFGLFRSSEPNLKVIGHYVHVKDGRYSAEPPYASSPESVEETIGHLTRDAGRPKYDHVVLYAHGGINSLDSAVARTAAMVEGFKRNRIWPIFYLWRTGLGEVAGDLIKQVWDRVTGRAGGLPDLTDTLIENVASTLVAPFWKEMKADAALSADTRQAGDAWKATKRVIEAVVARPGAPMQVHFIGHSAGAIFLARLFERAASEGFALAGALGTVSLFAPACSIEMFNTMLRPVAKGLVGAREPFAVYNLADETERDDNVAGLYRKSLLYLVSNAFERAGEKRLAGMDKFMRDNEDGIAYHLSGTRDRRGRPIPEARWASRSTTHGGFDNDPLTMNHVLARILGRPGPGSIKQGFNSAELASDQF